MRESKPPLRPQASLLLLARKICQKEGQSLSQKPAHFLHDRGSLKAKYLIVYGWMDEWTDDFSFECVILRLAIPEIVSLCPRIVEANAVTILTVRSGNGETHVKTRAPNWENAPQAPG